MKQYSNDQMLVEKLLKKRMDWPILSNNLKICLLLFISSVLVLLQEVSGRCGSFLGRCRSFQVVAGRFLINVDRFRSIFTRSAFSQIQDQVWLAIKKSKLNFQINFGRYIRKEYCYRSILEKFKKQKDSLPSSFNTRNNFVNFPIFCRQRY